jgi:hypothetical protein
MERVPTGSLFFFRDRFVAVLIQQHYVMEFFAARRRAAEYRRNWLEFAGRASISRARVGDDVACQAGAQSAKA